MNYPQWLKKYLASSGNPYKDAAWLIDRFNRGHKPQDAAADSRWVFPSDFDALVARVKLAKFEQGRLFA